MPKIWGNKLQRGSFTNLFVTWGYLRHIFALNLLDSYVLLKSQVEGAFIKIAGCVSFAQDDYEKTKQHVIHLHDFVVIVSKQNPWDAGVPRHTALTSQCTSFSLCQGSSFAKHGELLKRSMDKSGSWKTTGLIVAQVKASNSTLPNWSQLLFLPHMFDVCAFKHRENPDSVAEFINRLQHINWSRCDGLWLYSALSWNQPPKQYCAARQCSQGP